MKLSPQKFREMVLLFLFSKDFHDSDETELKRLVGEELKVATSEATTAKHKAEAIELHLLELDAQISAATISYEFHRIGRVEKNILRLALYEFLHDKTVSKEIIIAEAKRLAKKFSSPEAALFCQAVLDTLVKKG